MSNFYIDSLSTVTAENKQTTSDNLEEIRVLTTEAQETKTKLQNALDQGVENNRNITRLDQSLVNLKEDHLEKTILQLEGRLETLENGTLTEFRSITSITDRLEKDWNNVLTAQAKGDDSEDCSQISEDETRLSDRVE